MTRFVIVFTLASCGGSALPPCHPTRANAIAAECNAKEMERGCWDNPEKYCPDLVAECDRRIDALTDKEVCQ